MGASQAFSLYFWSRYQRILKNLSEKEVSAVQSDLTVSKDVVLKNILKYSHKYLLFEVIQGIEIFRILYACVGGKSSPGLPRGRREFYH